MFTRRLGRSGLEVGAIGLGCWAIGGPFWRGERPIGWGQVDAAESIRAIHRALDLGVTVFDTSDAYGAGHSERILGQALAGRRQDAVIATKVGLTFDEQTRQLTGEDASPAYLRRACEASLRRLNTDHIDLYQFHPGDYAVDRAVAVRDVLEELVAAGKIRYYAWSTEQHDGVRVFGEGPHCTATQNGLDLLRDHGHTRGDDRYAAICEEFDLAWLCNGPLASGILTGKFTVDSQLPADDVRRRMDFVNGPQAAQLRQLEAVRDVLTQGGRTLAQGALGWVLARSERTIPIPGFKTVAQVEENAAAADFGPLRPEQMREIEALLGAP